MSSGESCIWSIRGLDPDLQCMANKSFTIDELLFDTQNYFSFILTGMSLANIWLDHLTEAKSITALRHIMEYSLLSEREN